MWKRGRRRSSYAVNILYFNEVSITKHDQMKWINSIVKWNEPDPGINVILYRCVQGRIRSILHIGLLSLNNIIIIMINSNNNNIKRYLRIFHILFHLFQLHSFHSLVYYPYIIVWLVAHFPYPISYILYTFFFRI